MTAIIDVQQAFEGDEAILSAITMNTEEKINPQMFYLFRLKRLQV